MKINYKKTPGHAIVDVAFEGAEVAKVAKTSLEDLCKNVTVKGFRKGKAPVDLARGHVDNNKWNETITQRLFKKAMKAIQADVTNFGPIYNNMILTRTPSLSILDNKEDKNGTVFSISFLMLPTISELGNIEKLKIEFEPKKVEDSDIEAQIQRLIDDETMFVPSEEEIKSGDSVDLKIKISVNGVHQREFDSNSFPITVGKHVSFLKEHEDELFGKKVGDRGTISFVADKENLSSFVDSKIDFEYSVVSVSKAEVPALDDEFAKTQTAYNDVNTLEELKASIRKTLEENAAREDEATRINLLREEIIKNSKVEEDSAELKKELIDYQSRVDANELAAKGIDLETFLNISHMTLEDYHEKIFNYAYKPLLDRALDAAISEKFGSEIKEISEEEICKERHVSSFNNFVEQWVNICLRSGYPEREARNYAQNKLGELITEYKRRNINEYIISKQ